MVSSDTTPPAKVTVDRVTQLFRERGQSMVAVEDVSLEAREGEFVTIIGPSGCGKSTLFNLIAGLEEPSKGRILLNGRELPSRIGQTGYMFQKDLLVPWRTVVENAALGLELTGMDRHAARERAAPLLEEFGLAGFERYYPHQLSGGMRQRAAFLRTVLTRKDILLLDEPFGSLDALTRTAMQEWLLAMWERPRGGGPRATILFITHDVEEAVFLSDRVYVMSPRPGRLVLELPIALARPRRADMLTSLPFLDHKRWLLEALRRETDHKAAAS